MKVEHRRGQCQHCQRELLVIVHPNGTFCRGCRKRLPLVSCNGCGEPLRNPEGVEPRCNRCRRGDRFEGIPCSRCGRLPERGRRGLLDGRVVCSPCRQYLQPPTRCSMCGEVRDRCCRDFVLGIVEPACGRCRKRHSQIPNCAGCHRPRYPAGERDGKPYCALCLKTGQPPVIRCTVCHQKRPAYSTDTCEDCSWERSHQRLLANLVPTFKSEWAPTLFEAYHRDAKLRCKRGAWRRNLQRDVHFFQLLEQHFERAEDLSAVLIVRRLGWDVVRPFRRAMSYLAHAGFVVLDTDPDYKAERMIGRLRKRIARASPWIAEVLTAFLEDMLLRRARVSNRKRRTNVPTSPQSLDSGLRVADRLLAFAESKHGVQDLRQLDQNVLDLFLGAHKNYRLGVTNFIRYANSHGKLFAKLRLPDPPRLDIPAQLFLPDAVRLEKIQMLTAMRDPRHTRWALIAVFNLVYAQMGYQSGKMRLDQVQECEDGYLVRFAKQWLLLDPEIVPLMRQWMGQRREISAFEVGNSPYLFPGQQTGTHIAPTAGYEFRMRYNVGARQGRATALATLVRNGMDQPRMLADCYGISLIRAHQYCSALGARDRAQSRFARQAYGD